MAYNVGLDLSITSSGVVIVKEDDPTHLPYAQFTVNTKVEDGIGDISRFSLIAEELERKITKEILEKPDTLIFAENMATRATGQLTRIAEMKGIVRYVMYKKYGKDITFVSPMTLKKFAAGKSAGSGKGPVMVGCFKSWGFETKSNDIADAFVLAKMAQMYRNVKIDKKYTVDEPKYRFECLTTIEKADKDGRKKKKK